jgi:hypothetical protein
MRYCPALPWTVMHPDMLEITCKTGHEWIGWASVFGLVRFPVATISAVV